MGLLNKLVGSADKNLLENGVLGRAIVLGVQATGTSIQRGGGIPEQVCRFQLQVRLDGEQPYETTSKLRIPLTLISQFQPGATEVAVRVNPDNPNDVAIDLATPPPTVTAAATPGQESAASILLDGTPAKAVIISSQPAGLKTPAGVDVYAFVLTVMPDGADPYQITVGNPTPPAALPFLFPGSHVPVRIGSDPNSVVIDWDAAKAASSA